LHFDIVFGGWAIGALLGVPDYTGGHPCFIYSLRPEISDTIIARVISSRSGRPRSARSSRPRSARPPARSQLMILPLAISAPISS
jgi:hypothetical protein